MNKFRDGPNLDNEHPIGGHLLWFCVMISQVTGGSKSNLLCRGHCRHSISWHVCDLYKLLGYKLTGKEAGNSDFTFSFVHQTKYSSPG